MGSIRTQGWALTLFISVKARRMRFDPSHSPRAASYVWRIAHATPIGPLLILCQRQLHSICLQRALACCVQWRVAGDARYSRHASKRERAVAAALRGEWHWRVFDGRDGLSAKEAPEWCAILLASQTVDEEIGRGAHHQKERCAQHSA